MLRNLKINNVAFLSFFISFFRIGCLIKIYYIANVNSIVISYTLSKLKKNHMSADDQKVTKQSGIQVGQCIIPTLIVEQLRRDFFIQRATLVDVLERGTQNTITTKNTLSIRTVEHKGQTFDAELKLADMGDKQLFGRRVVGPAYIFDTIDKPSK